MAVWKCIHKSVRKAPILRLIWQLPSLNSHNSDHRGTIDLNYFSMARPLPGLGDGHINCPKSPFLARVISVQSIDTKWYFWAFFYGTASLFWFSVVLLPLSGFWPFSFKPRLASLGGVITYNWLFKMETHWRTQHCWPTQSVRANPWCYI